MIFFVTIQPRPAPGHLPTAEEIGGRLRRLNKMKAEGWLLHSYVLTSGGTVFVVKADSLATVREALRSGILAPDTAVEVLEVNPFSPLLVL